MKECTSSSMLHLGGFGQYPQNFRMNCELHSYVLLRSTMNRRSLSPSLCVNFVHWLLKKAISLRIQVQTLLDKRGVEIPADASEQAEVEGVVVRLSDGR